MSDHHPQLPDISEAMLVSIQKAADGAVMEIKRHFPKEILGSMVPVGEVGFLQHTKEYIMTSLIRGVLGHDEEMEKLHHELSVRLKEDIETIREHWDVTREEDELEATLPSAPSPEIIYQWIESALGTAITPFLPPSNERQRH